MENFWIKVFPRKSFSQVGLVTLSLFLLFGVVVIVIASTSVPTLKCGLEDSPARDKLKIETQCSLRYTKQFSRLLPLHVLFVINFAIMLILSFIYAYLVKHRVEYYADPLSLTTVDPSNVEDRSQLLMSPAASNAVTHQKTSVSYFVFTVYIMQLIFGRIIPSVVFAALLLNASNYPTNFKCSYPSPIQTKSTLYGNLTLKQGTNFSTVDCTNPAGKTNDGLAVSVISANFLYGAITLIELAYLLWSTWKDNDLLTDLEFCSVYILRKRKRIRKFMKKLKERIPHDIFQLYEDFGETRLSSRKLKEMYVDIIIQDGRQNTWTDRHKYRDRHKICGAYFKSPTTGTILNETAELFKIPSKNIKHPRTILVVGMPGIGKSLLTKRIFYQYQQQAHEFWNDKIVILIRFRTFNYRKTSLQEMLRHSDGLGNVSSTDFLYMYEYICLNPRNVVIIFDGLDELKIDGEFLPEENTVRSHNEVTDVLLIFKQLVKGELLPGVIVLTTSRPTAKPIYLGLQFDREVEILGFHEEQIKNYVRNFCINDLSKGTKIWEYIKESPELLSFCFIPINSYIVCLTLTQTMNNEMQNLQSNSPRTITELYKKAIKVLLYKHHLKFKSKLIPKDYMIEELPEDLQNDLNELKEIAWNGMINDELIFEFQIGAKFVTDNSRFRTELSDCGLFNQLEDKRHNFFCFLDLTIQEFLAAQHVVDDMKNAESFISENISKPRWHLVIQFVAGLIGDKIKELKAERNVSIRSTEEKRIIERICMRFQDWIPKTGQLDRTRDTLLVIKCVHEMQDVDITKSVSESFLCEDDGRRCKEFYLYELDIAPLESIALFELLYYIKSLYVTDCFMPQFSFSEFCNLLSGSTEITELHMTRVEITDYGANCITDALRNGNCNLMKLNIKGCELKNIGVNYLSNALKSVECNLTELHLSDNGFTDQGAKYLSDALKSDNCKLTKLDISDNELADVGAGHLSNALNSKNCNLTKLKISGNKLTGVGAGYLSDAVRSKNCKLTKLNISGNKLTCVGAAYLSEAVRSKNCKLTKLNISVNELTDVGAGYLSDAVKNKNCKLTKLNISDNELTDAGAEYLSDALENENCKLVGLNMRFNKLTDVGAKYLGDALKSDNCKLIELNIDFNQLTAESAKYLSGALKRDNCRLTALGLCDNNLTDVGAQ